MLTSTGTILSHPIQQHPRPNSRPVDSPAHERITLSSSSRNPSEPILSTSLPRAPRHLDQRYNCFKARSPLSDLTSSCPGAADTCIWQFFVNFTSTSSPARARPPALPLPHDTEDIRTSLLILRALVFHKQEIHQQHKLTE
ncbi:hypothetical protein CTAM01_05533 [Colletotrichum tamarilloi]|uniref:Uncharacterized protein n=1 Tax=Colletotrichum tamarilloi TaxID=1209934 RepID=A0ABQ9REA2_9PEZI|nr:uncharacterized protein CTAM01_05533 [Colletotrichum tamarilloi]KAK1502095.1 hypothetical protein CTAM01_05533 [Colletotrichum tamarilloi]